MIRVTDLKTAKRLLSKLIYQFQKKEIDSQYAKDLTYLLTSYVNFHKVIDIEQRIIELETKMEKRK